METKKTKRVVEDIDETFLLNSIAEQGIVKETAKPAAEPAETGKAVETPEPPEKPKEAREAKEAKETGRRRRNPAGADYGSLFFQRNGFKTRQCVYISQRIHTTISEIVRVISDRDITVGGYIDSILMEHLETHREEIAELYNRELEKRSGKNLMEF
jgi:hypothetical protein